MSDNKGVNRGAVIKWLAIVLIIAGVAVTAVDIVWMYRHGYSSDKTRGLVFRGLMIALLLIVVLSGHRSTRRELPRDHEGGGKKRSRGR